MCSLLLRATRSFGDPPGFRYSALPCNQIPSISQVVLSSNRDSLPIFRIRSGRTSCLCVLKVYCLSKQLRRRALHFGCSSTIQYESHPIMGCNEYRSSIGLFGILRALCSTSWPDQHDRPPSANKLVPSLSSAIAFDSSLGTTISLVYQLYSSWLTSQTSRTQEYRGSQHKAKDPIAVES